MAASLHVLSGLGEAVQRSKEGPLLHLQRMNATLYSALKIDELSWKEQGVLADCLKRLPMPTRLDDAAVIAALADPYRDFLQDFADTPFCIRRPWHNFISARFRGDREGEDAVKIRLGFIRRTILPHWPPRAETET